MPAQADGRRPQGSMATVERSSSSRQGLQLALCALAVTLIGLSYLTPGYLRGDGEVWLHSISDRATSLVGYLYFLAKPWALPLFRLDRLSTPEGMTLINSDSIPLVVLLGHLVFDLTGARINLYGLFVLACLVLNAVAAVLLARRFGVRDLTRQLCVAVLFASLPFWLVRYYHVSLSAHALLLFAILVYLRAQDGGQVRRSYLAMTALIGLACLVHIYLWAMVMLVAGAMIARDLFDREGSVTERLGPGAAMLGFSALAIWASGYLGLRGAGENVGYMSFSTNLLSLFWSSHSAFSPRSWELLREMQDQRNPWIFFAGQRPDATGAQYLEGMSYLGAGVLALTGFAITRVHRIAVGEIIRRHGWLLLAALVALLFAVTPQITFGERILTRWQPDAALLSLFSTLRASGRFIWLPAYLAIVAATMLAARTLPLRASQIVFVVAAAVQFADAQPLRQAIRFDGGQGVVLFNEDAWRPVLADVGEVVILPSFECSDEDKATLKTGFHLLAARFGPIPINSASQSRSTKDCRSENALLDGGPKPGRIYLFFDTDPSNPAITAFKERHAGLCRPFAYGTVCREAGAVVYDACRDPLARPRVAACAKPAQP